MRHPVLGVLARDGPDARLEVDVGPLHIPNFPAPLRRDQAQPKSGRHLRGFVVELRPQVPDLISRQHPVPALFDTRPRNVGNRVALDDLLLDSKVEHLAQQRAETVRCDRGTTQGYVHSPTRDARCGLPLNGQRRLRNQIPFGAPSRGLHVPCVRFPAGFAPGPRNTRLRMVASLCRGRTCTCWVPPGGFRHVCRATYGFPLLQA